jgi:hypothetical protein
VLQPKTTFSWLRAQAHLLVSIATALSSPTPDTRILALTAASARLFKNLEWNRPAFALLVAPRFEDPLVHCHRINSPETGMRLEISVRDVSRGHQQRVRFGEIVYA